MNTADHAVATFSKPAVDGHASDVEGVSYISSTVVGLVCMSENCGLRVVEHIGVFDKALLRDTCCNVPVSF